MFRVDFGKKTLIVGPNNSGKSSIFKAFDFFLRNLTEYTDKESGPWIHLTVPLKYMPYSKDRQSLGAHVASRLTYGLDDL